MFSGTPTGRKRRVLYITDFHVEEKLLGAVEIARERNWELISNMRFHGLFPSETEADGLLITCYGERTREWLSLWKRTPAVHLGISPPVTGLPWVDCDHATVGRLGAEHLMGLGKVHHAFYSLLVYPETRIIRDAFENRLQTAGLGCTRLDFEADHESDPMEIPRELRLTWLARRLGSLPRPLAVMTDDDRRSLEIVAACELAGLRIPEDVTVLGCENRAVEVRLSPVPLSSVDLNHRHVGRRAAELLDQLMIGETVHSSGHRVQPAGVAARESTATVFTGNPGIDRCVLRIRTEYAGPLRLTDLARLAGMSERQFRAEFRRLTGHCPRQEIQKVRMEAANRLLRDTDLKLEAVASESGFGSAKKLCEAFGRHHGVSPHRWRLRHREGEGSSMTKRRIA